jgi:hypothetical protein
MSQVGVWLPEEVMSHERFFSSLASFGWKPIAEESPSVGSYRGPTARAGIGPTP